MLVSSKAGMADLAIGSYSLGRRGVAAIAETAGGEEMSPFSRYVTSVDCSKRD